MDYLYYPIIYLDGYFPITRFLKFSKDSFTKQIHISFSFSVAQVNGCTKTSNLCRTN